MSATGRKLAARTTARTGRKLTLGYVRHLATGSIQAAHRSSGLKALLLPRLHRHILDPCHLQLLTFVARRHHRLTDVQRARRPANLATIIYFTRETGLAAFHHGSPVVELL